MKMKLPLQIKMAGDYVFQKSWFWYYVLGLPRLLLLSRYIKLRKSSKRENLFDDYFMTNALSDTNTFFSDFCASCYSFICCYKILDIAVLILYLNAWGPMPCRDTSNSWNKRQVTKWIHHCYVQNQLCTLLCVCEGVFTCLCMATWIWQNWR